MQNPQFLECVDDVTKCGIIVWFRTQTWLALELHYFTSCDSAVQALILAVDINLTSQV